MEFKYNGNETAHGVYRILNEKTGKFYIGSTGAPFRKRWINHAWKLKAGRHNNLHLQNAFNKYGTENFVFEILELSLDDDTGWLAVEQKYLDAYVATEHCYNIEKKAKSLPGVVFSHTPEETRAKISASNKGRISKMRGVPRTDAVKQKCRETQLINWQDETVRAKGMAQLAKLHADEDNRKKISSRMTGTTMWVGRKHKPESILRMAAAKARPFTFMDPSGNIVSGVNLCAFCRINNLHDGAMFELMYGKNGRKSHKGWTCPAEFVIHRPENKKPDQANDQASCTSSFHELSGLESGEHDA